MSSRSRHSRRTLPTQRSGWAFAFGAWISVQITVMPSLATTASNAAANFFSADVDQEPHRLVTVGEVHQQVADCCIMQAVSGLLVRAKYSLRRLPIEGKTNTD